MIILERYLFVKLPANDLMNSHLAILSDLAK